MKTLRKISLDGFDRLSITEASRLFGGNGDNPPTTSTVPNDSISGNKNDSIPPNKTTPKQTFGVEVKHEQNNSTTTQGTYKVETTSGFSFGATGGWNSKTGGFGGVTVSYTIGGQKK